MQVAAACSSPQGYAHLFNLQGVAASRATDSASSNPDSAGVDPVSAQLSRLPGNLLDKFEGHVMVPIELWLQAHKEAQVGGVHGALAVLIEGRLRIDGAQRGCRYRHTKQAHKEAQVVH